VGNVSKWIPEDQRSAYRWLRMVKPNVWFLNLENSSSEWSFLLQLGGGGVGVGGGS
jgi:hypothetical protein